MLDAANQDEPFARAPCRPLVEPGGIELFAADMTATIGAQMPLAEIQRRLAEVQQWLPVDAADEQTPVAALVERNSTGPLRLGYGAWRDLLLGCQFTNGRGELITAGGRVMKNVAGYDLTKFMVGQHGVFGRLVTITTRTYRRPGVALTALFEPQVRHLQKLLLTPCRPQWALLDADHLSCGYLGDERTIAFIESALPAFAPRAIGSRTGAYVSPLISNDAQERFHAAVPPARIAEFATAAGVHGWKADPAFGVVWGSLEPGTDRQIIRAAARGVRGSVYFCSSDGRLSEVEVLAAQRQVIERLKQAFDPDGRLTPLPFT
jgi:FAD/FMN-containing dehydrogenase